MEIYKEKQQENFTLVVTRDELSEIRDALGVRCIYLDALLRKKRSKNPEAQLPPDKSHNMYIQITKELEYL